MHGDAPTRFRHAVLDGRASDHRHAPALDHRTHDRHQNLQSLVGGWQWAPRYRPPSTAETSSRAAIAAAALDEARLTPPKVDKTCQPSARNQLQLTEVHRQVRKRPLSRFT